MWFHQPASKRLRTAWIIETGENLPRFVTAYPAVETTIEEQEVIRELESIVITRNIPEHGLRRGDIGAVVHCYKDGVAFEVEFVTAKGDTVAVITLESKDVRPMYPNEILHAREIRAA